jgi:hypothetical protein
MAVGLDSLDKLYTMTGLNGRKEGRKSLNFESELKVAIHNGFEKIERN